MLENSDKSLLEDHLNKILYAPEEISQLIYSTTYNTVYKHCSEPSSEFHIKGSEIYSILSKEIEKFSHKIQLTASIPSIAQQLVAFKKTAHFLSTIFAHLDRFYVRVSKSFTSDILNVRDLFYSSIYYNYIYKIEDSIMELILLEIDTCRQNLIQGCNDLKIVVTLYTEILVVTNQEERLKNFYRMYMKNFEDHTNFNIEINKLTKKIYLEMCFVTNILCDKSMCKEIVQKIDHRKEDLVKYIFSKMKSFEDFKRPYKILIMMDEVTRSRVKIGFEEFVGNLITNSASFDDLFKTYSKIKHQIESNKLIGYSEIFEKATKIFLKDKSDQKLNEIYKSFISHISALISNTRHDKYKELELLTAKRDIAGNDQDESFTISNQSAGDVEAKQLKHNELYSEDRNIIDLQSPAYLSNSFYNSSFQAMSDNCTSQLDKPANRNAQLKLKYPVLINNALTADEKTGDSNFVNFIDLFEILFSENLIEMYTKECQLRLLSGSNPQTECEVLNLMISRVGLGNVSKLKNSISTYLNFDSVEFQLDEYRVSVYKHTKGFWPFEPYNIQLHPLLEQSRSEVGKLIKKTSRETLHENIRLSPVIFELDGIVYKINTDLASLLLYIDEDSLSVEKLKLLSNDPNFDLNYKFLVENDFICEGEILRLKPRRTNKMFLNFFVVDQFNIVKEKAEDLEHQRNSVVDAGICKIMKSLKELDVENIYNECPYSRHEIQESIQRLEYKGYISVEESKIKYIP